jgi:nicotinate dehydrogenase subunit B
MRADESNSKRDPGHDVTHDLSRRDFLALAGSGLFVLFLTDPLDAFQEPARLPGRPSYPTDFNAYLHVAADGRVTCLVGKVELGQGAKTALAQLLSEELDVPLDSVDMVMGDTDRCPWDMGTFGSLTIRQFGPVLRGAAAEARAVLLQMASERLEVPAEMLQVKAGVITSATQGKHITYAELVQGKRIERHLERTAVKPVSAFSVIGQSPARKDAFEKVTGKAQYAGDIVLRDMLHARIVRPPAHGATVKSVDTSAAEKIQGVQVIKDGDLVAVLHPRRDIADKARGLIKAPFEPPQPTVDDKTIFDH